ncbi:MAG: type IV pilus twitching motility protein PilT [Lentisphaeria bacterium]|jgi:twitching motility protein PilT
MNEKNITKHIDWFCYHVVSEKLLSAEDCIAVLEAIEGENLTPTVDLIIQVVHDNELCGNLDRLNELKEMSKQEADVFGFPSRSIFSSTSPPLAPKAPAPPVARAAQGPPPAPAGSATISQAAPLPSANAPAWLQDWPDLNQAAGLDLPQAQNLLNDFLHRARKEKCSDVHLSAGAYPFVRRYKEIFYVPGQNILSEEAAERLNLAPLSEEQREKFLSTHDLDYSYSISLQDRYRTNLLKQRLGIAGAYRIIDSTVRSIRELGFRNPDVVEKLTTNNQGLILITGPAGCGKSTTLAALVDYVNRNRKDHIVSVEDPIEIIHHPKGCNVTQRELHSHTRSFGNALRAALREDPDVIVIGEMRDLETIEMAIHSSETGHLVIGTLHTSSAADTMNRILDVFPYNQQAQIRAMVAESLKGVICQQLFTNINGDGVVLGAEIMLGTLAISNLIREGKTFQIDSTLQTSRNVGMSTMEQSHVDLFKSGVRSYEQTIPYVRNQELIREMQVFEAQRMGARKAEAAANEKQKRKWF